MNEYCVPNFLEMEDDCEIPTTSGFSRPKKPAVGEGEIMELLWQNGQVVVQRSTKKSTPFVCGSGIGEAAPLAEPAEVREIRAGGAEEQQYLFMQEDEMASWLQYPLDDSLSRDFCADLFYSAPPPPPTTTVAPTRAAADIRPPPAPPLSPQKLENSPRVQNFVHFSRLPSRPRIEPISTPSVTTTRESTVVDSNETPMVGPYFRFSLTVEDSITRVNGEAECRTSVAGGELAAHTCELTATSSPGGSGASFSPSVEPLPSNREPEPSAAAEDRKRKARETDDNECQSEDIEIEATEAKKQARGSSSTKRSRAAEVHNLAERRRRDRINEKMRALQELIPRCNKSDKASMLDEAIEYLKSLQLQVQMMSMGCGMVPMIYPGVQQYMPAMGMGMGIGMGVEMGMNRPIAPYPSMLPPSALHNPAAAAHMAPRFPMPAFHLQQVPVSDLSRCQFSNQNDPLLNPLNPNQPRMQNFVNPYQQFLGLHQAQLPLPQNQAMVQHSTKHSTSKEVGNPENKQSDRK